MTDQPIPGQPGQPTPGPAPEPDLVSPTEAIPVPEPATYSPPVEARPTWTAEAVGPAEPPTPSYWLEPAPVAPAIKSAPPRGGTSTGRLAGMLLVVALLAAVLSSTGTYVLLRASGAVGQASPAATVNANSTSTKTVTIDEQSAITQAAAAVSPAVVTITSSQGQSLNPLGNQVQTGIGSGIIYDANGWIVTNRHVVCGADSLTITLKDGREFSGKTYGTDTLTDLAIVKVEATGLPAAVMGESSDLKPGQLAIAIGSPLGDYTNSVTAGVISGSGRDIQVNDDCSGGTPLTVRHLVQTDAAINPGNSGGALVDSQGQVIGINTAVAGQAQGIGFAIPIDIAKPIMNQAVAGQQLARPYMGIIYQAITPQLAKANSLPIDYGAWIKADTQTGGSRAAVVAGSPADTAGLKEGDIITAVNGQRIDAAHSLDDILVKTSPGDTVTVTILRDGQSQDLRLTLGTRPAGLQ
ncbi:MAG: trypsin-like peptidase domain-containing protein [Candidatus Limnocylindrales bacterium]